MDHFGFESWIRRMVHYSERLFDSIIYLVRLGSKPPVFKKLYCFYDILASAIEGSSA